MNYEALKFWMAVAQFASTIGIGIYAWWSNRDKITNARFKEHDKRLNELEKKTDNPRCPHHPSFEARLDKMNGSLNKVDGRLEGIGRAVDLMNQFLINGGK